jgi:hypothetical protein
VCCWTLSCVTLIHSPLGAKIFLRFSLLSSHPYTYRPWCPTSSPPPKKIACPSHLMLQKLMFFSEPNHRRRFVFQHWACSYIRAALRDNADSVDVWGLFLTTMSWTLFKPEENGPRTSKPLCLALKSLSFVYVLTLVPYRFIHHW